MIAHEARSVDLPHVYLARRRAADDMTWHSRGPGSAFAFVSRFLSASSVFIVVQSANISDLIGSAKVLPHVSRFGLNVFFFLVFLHFEVQSRFQTLCSVSHQNKPLRSYIVYRVRIGAGWLNVSLPELLTPKFSMASSVCKSQICYSYHHIPSIRSTCCLSFALAPSTSPRTHSEAEAISSTATAGSGDSSPPMNTGGKA